MTEQEVLNILPFIFPLYTALISGLLLQRLCNKGESQLEKRSIQMAIWAYISAIFAWLSIVFYIVIPQLFVVFNAPVMWIFMGYNILYYRFVFDLTKTHESEKFSILHFAIPTLIALVLFVWSFFIPFDVQLQLVESRGEPSRDYPYYSALFTSKPLLFVLFHVVYTVFCLLRVIRFRRVVVNYSADEERTSLRWLYQILFVMLGSLPAALGFMLLTKQQLTSFPINIFLALVFMFKDVMLVHNILLDNFVVISSDTSEKEIQTPPTDRELPEQINREDVHRLEIYMSNNRPYLNPKLKITEIAQALNTNRSSLSALINGTYGMNFCRFVNRYRLDELDRLKSHPNNTSLSELELVAKAGFSDWRGYQRVKSREEEFNLKQQ
ncbi:helix-turn-helix transcriptional regulator [Dysgonomonas sp. Marseille-P4677]|uniref:helix-turn-helix domain-containing protein n=1 Tax=Dysgonomonas sp. Marseille-P4677 TaxID=2364790 RepID=UPI00191323E1|nr:AraC family transcriptional regulator [Dysgonomonas sp. Marseille-P4677]MBK5720797.1 helix-turn-helix transcriptional regulator [Dysgonomonas sp. Marseille-P4677]